MKKIIASILLIILTAMSFTSCSSAKKDAKPAYDASNPPDYTYLAGKKIGIAAGAIYDSIVADINAEPAYYSEISAGITDVREGRITGYMEDLSVIQALVKEKGNEDLTYIQIPADIFTAPMGGISVNQDIIDSFNKYLADAKADGSFDEIYKRWFGDTADNNTQIPDIPLTGTNGTLKICFTGQSPPFTFLGSDGKYSGYCVELAERWAASEGKNVDFTTVGFDGFMAYVISGKADIMLDAISVTDERKKSVIFTDTIYDDTVAVAILK